MFSLSTTLWGDVSLFFVWIIDVVSTLIYYIHSWFPPIRIHTAWRLMLQNVIKLPPAQAPLGLSITFRIKNTTWPGLDLLLQPHFTPCSRLLSLPWSERLFLRLVHVPRLHPTRIFTHPVPSVKNLLLSPLVLSTSLHITHSSNDTPQSSLTLLTPRSLRISVVAHYLRFCFSRFQLYSVFLWKN